MANMKKLLSRMLDLILPRRERSVRTTARTFEDIPVSPASLSLDRTRITTLMDYREPIIEDLIRSLKYDGSAHAASLCASALSDFLREEISSSKLFSEKRVLLVPVPLHKSRERERGFNQVDIVLKRLPQEFRNGDLASLAPHALARIRATRQQTHLSRDERIQNVKGAFAAVSQSIIKDTHIFLIDDVTTTGATLESAGKRLEAAGAKVTLIAFARA
ncbi:MAG: Amidophosphoribosyltransferase-like protein [Parcubacteria group bacterium GW2011_GWA2_51_10]|nr:MAG: Amidophosphoribosyltransferase-like protein [Parcubacteria group bacterium GW2011_GWA2_51_10]